MGVSINRVKRALEKRRNIVAIGIFIIMLARSVYTYQKGNQMEEDLLNAFDQGNDKILQNSELTKLLNINGVNLTGDQVKLLFGAFDNENNGFDADEVGHVLRILGELPSASRKLRDIASNTDRGHLDLAITAIVGCGVFYLLNQQDKTEQKLVGRRFLEVVRMRKQQAACNLLQQKLSSYATERTDLEKKMEELEKGAKQRTADGETVAELKKRLEDLDDKKALAEKRLEEDLHDWRKKAEDAMQESTSAKNMMESVMACIAGVESFVGKGKGEMTEAGAQAGFEKQNSATFATSVITFGTVENGQVIMYETDQKKKLGEGADCAYKAKNIQSGEEYALKLYTLRNHSQRRQIQNDLAAYRTKVGTHKRVVGYERVIEAQDHIFVLMQLIKGRDLFDLVIERGFTEAEAKPLFLQHVEALKFLHSKGVIHCDVKPENAMVKGSVDDGTAELVVIDFGFSCFSTSAEGDADATSAVGDKISVDRLVTRSMVPVDCYAAPEHLADSKCEPKPSTDMWRLGCLLYIMLVRNTPWNHDQFQAKGIQKRKDGMFVKPPQYTALSDDAKDLTEKLINGDPLKRPSCEEVMQHPWFKGVAA